jgi:hypothetical protein
VDSYRRLPQGGRLGLNRVEAKMPETLLSPSNILLYGRVVQDLRVVHFGAAGTPIPPPPPPPGPPPANEQEVHRPSVSARGGANLFLQRQLEDGSSRLARIYGFSFEGQYYDLPKPALFLVHGDGDLAENLVGAGGNARQARAPDVADLTGVAAQDYSFSTDMRVWSYDTGDYSIRLDVETGPLDQILLEATLGGAGGTYAGANARIAGANVGANARIAGANVGANVGANAGIRRGGGWSD